MLKGSRFMSKMKIAMLICTGMTISAPANAEWLFGDSGRHERNAILILDGQYYFDAIDTGWIGEQGNHYDYN